MKYFVSILVGLFLTGCQSYQSELEREIEILKLERKKAMLEYQILFIENLEMSQLPIKDPLDPKVSESEE